MDHLTDSLPVTFEKIFEEPKIFEIVFAAPHLQTEICRFIEGELIKLSAMVNVSGNLTDYQVEHTAKNLAERYNRETLADFKLCFHRGAMGYYGPIFRLDGIVIAEWMNQYLNEKYLVLENAVTQRKEQTQTENKLNYEAYKTRIREQLAKEKNRNSNARENEIARQKIEHPYRYFKVQNLEIYATSQEHAAAIVEGMIKRGELEETINE